MDGSSMVGRDRRARHLLIPYPVGRDRWARRLTVAFKNP